MTRILRFVCLVLSMVLLSAGYWQGGRVWPVLGILVLGILFCLGLGFRWDWISPVGLFFSFGVAAAGLMQNLSPLLLISAAFFALLAWDLADFHVRLQKASPEDDTAGLEKRHLLRLVLPALAGTGLGVVGLTIHLKPNFEWTVVVMLFMLWGVNRVVTWLLKKQ
jgi:hypothetical protein